MTKHSSRKSMQLFASVIYSFRLYSHTSRCLLAFTIYIGLANPVIADTSKSVFSTASVASDATMSRSLPPAFNGCDAEQQNLLITLTGLTENRVVDVIAELESLPDNQRATSPRFERWFGPYTAERYAKVQAGYAAILDALTGQTLDYDCSCEEGDLVGDLPSTPLAYVNGDYNVTFCPAFLQNALNIKPATYETHARDVGLMIHEVSHFGQVLNTQDYYLSGLDAASLSLTAPSVALKSARNFEMFGVNAFDDPLENDGTALPQRFPSAAPAVLEERPDAIALQPETQVRGLLEKDGQAIYTTTGTPFIVLTSLAGNSDLYVYTDDSFAEDTLVCSSSAISISNRLGLDICEVDASQTYQVVVDQSTYGEDALTYADYAIVATANSPNYGLGDPTIGQLLRLNLPISYAMNAATFQSYYISGASAVSIKATNGSLFLIVDSASTPFSNAPICQLEVSANVGESTGLCEISEDEDYAVRVSSLPDEINGLYEFDIVASSSNEPVIPEPVVDPPTTDLPDTTDTPLPTDNPDTTDEAAAVKKKSSGLGAEWYWLIIASVIYSLRRCQNDGKFQL